MNVVRIFNNLKLEKYAGNKYVLWYGLNFTWVLNLFIYSIKRMYFVWKLFAWVKSIKFTHTYNNPVLIVSTLKESSVTNVSAFSKYGRYFKIYFNNSISNGCITSFRQNSNLCKCWIRSISRFLNAIPFTTLFPLLLIDPNFKL